MMHVHVLPFIGVAVLIVIAPGVDMALVTKNALRGGRASALATAAGVNVGVALWSLATAVGLATAVRASAGVFTAVRLIGALYLIALGTRALLATRRARGAQVDAAEVGKEAETPTLAFRQGLASNMLNPKMAVLFTSLLPQFIDRGSDPLPGLLVLGLVFNVLGVMWLGSFALAVARARSFFARPTVRRTLEAVTGGVLVSLGLRVALDRR